MGNPYISSSVVIRSLCYSEGSQEILYVFIVDGVERKLTGKMHDDSDIRGVEYSCELDEFVMLLMPFDEKTSKKLFSISWMYVDGEDVEFPITLIRL
ncbi:MULTISPECIES: hypothetical protein [Pseudomonas]|uniref:hypothetical protein n=1 Tax=Pseudomonas TaxID=286 RepID=UPI000686936F|nr:MULTISPECIES: hypothetical protein [Pseudomonas]MBP5107631.1 hypothetical protein [Pseudomonas protegens]MBP5111214.1 hypothetical protein [Pseudomonas protegens]MBP5127118.1 hypothetical protein [Pseudomonas protegens]MBP5127144.1 hypothetical protein [Pseudomonas protegens]MBP5133597.1 hypothetical protein [Pseudomonas protegens]